MKNIVEYGFPTLRTTDIITQIGGIALDPNATVSVSDLAANSGGLFSLQEDANGDLVLSCSKELGLKLQLKDSQNNLHTAEPFVSLYRGNEFIGTRPPVRRYA
jgi:hypothetical protein